jgi:hypothetical protein
MMISSMERSPQLCARVAGFLYLTIILLGLFGEVFVRGALVVAGDAAATARNIAGSPFLWRAGIVGDLLMQVCDVPVLVIFYLLLRPVSESLALLATWINLVQTAVLAANKLNLVVPLLLAADAGYLKAFSPEQLHALSYLAIEVHEFGFGIGLVFFGFACLATGWLIFRSGYLPRTLGVLMLMAGLSYLTNSLALLLAPSFAAAIFPGVLVPAFVGESALCLWLIVKGVDTRKWAQRGALRQALAPSN